MSNDASNSSKIFVTCMMIDLFVTKSLKDDFAHDPHTQYDLIVPIFRGGVTAININVETETETIDDYNKMWERVVEFLRLVLSNKDVPRKYYSPHTNAIKDILSICVNAVPRKKYSELEVVFTIGARESIEIAELYSCENKDRPTSCDDETAQKHINDALSIFVMSLKGLCKSAHSSESFHTIIEDMLSKCSEAIESCSKTKSNSRRLTFHIKKIISICEIIDKLSKVERSIIGLKIFPQLCKFMLSDNLKLRQVVSQILTDVDFQGLVEGARALEDKLHQSTVERDKELTSINNKLKLEEERVHNLTQINLQLINKIEGLESEAEEFQRQVLVSSEDLTYT